MEVMMSYRLNELGYPYDALEPNFDEKTMHLHHDKHHAAYIDKLNSLLAENGIHAPSSLEELIAKIDTLPGSDDFRSRVRFNAGGHYNHDLFWRMISPGGASTPVGLLSDAVVQAFGGLDGLKKQVEKSALSHLGVGWTWLCAGLEKRDELFICSTSNHDNPLMVNHVQRAGYPILLLDLWEHAYYLKYNNRKTEYIEAYWRVVNWDAVSSRFKSYIENR
ncbi:MAG: superoxide dismutase [Opitutales bacterium]|nr:superoxide dismutase [Opitutales bacterium]